MLKKLLPSLGLLAALMVPLGAIFAQAPPPVPALPDTERRTQYSISGTTCACSVGFALYGDSTDVDAWIEVWIGATRYLSTDATHGWALTSATGTLATIPRPITNAVLTFNAIQTGTVQIVGARRPRRAVQVQEGQGVPARAFNQAMTDVVAQNRETWDRTNDITGRTVRTPPGETMNTLPPLASRQGLGACYDSGGNLTACLSAPTGTFSAGAGITFTGTGPTVISTATFSAGTGIGFTGSNPTVLSATNVPNSALAPMPAATIKCNNTAGSATPIDCTASQAQALINGSSVAPQSGRFLPILTAGGCSSSSPFTCMQFCAYKGNLILINGAFVTIPAGVCVNSGGIVSAYNNACIEDASFVTTCALTLPPNTLYYAYIGMVTGTPTMIWSTNQHAPSGTSGSSPFGNEVMAGDVTRSLVGMCQTNAAGKFTGTANQQNCTSWFNPVNDGLQSTITGNFSAASYTDINPTGHLTYTQFSDNVPTVAANCVLTLNAGGPINPTLGIGISATGSAATLPSTTSQITVESSSVLRQVALQQSGSIGSEGYIIANLLGLSQSSTQVNVSSCVMGLLSRDPS
jgi:hypothetical protein